jgi:RNA-directed DNA polymerase
MMDMSVLFRGGGAFEDSLFHKIVSVPNLFTAWNEFSRGKKKKKDIAVFDLRLEDNIFKLHQELITKKYMHDVYDAFFICDPKRRHIHKASVRDRVLHQAIFQVLYPIFDKHFIYDSYSSRNIKGTHAGFERMATACRKVSGNWKKSAYALKCDVRKFFDSIDHTILRELLIKKITDSGTVWLIDLIFKSFEKQNGKGLPLGNVTSQLFANVYMNEFDQFAKHILKATYYFRYCDDFIIVHEDKMVLEQSISAISIFLKDTLSLDLHPHKVEIRKVKQGIDFLGYISLPHTTVVRTKTGKRIMRKLMRSKKLFNKKELEMSTFQAQITSYIGVLSHSKNKDLLKKVKYLKSNML